MSYRYLFLVKRIIILSHWIFIRSLHADMHLSNISNITKKINILSTILWYKIFPSTLIARYVILHFLASLSWSVNYSVYMKSVNLGLCQYSNTEIGSKLYSKAKQYMFMSTNLNSLLFYFQNILHLLEGFVNRFIV